MCNDRILHRYEIAIFGYQETTMVTDNILYMCNRENNNVINLTDASIYTE